MNKCKSTFKKSVFKIQESAKKLTEENFSYSDVFDSMTNVSYDVEKKSLAIILKQVASQISISSHKKTQIKKSFSSHLKIKCLCVTDIKDEFCQ